jgi:hypothetical protein
LTEIQSEEVASLKNGLNEDFSPKETTCSFKMPTNKEFNSSIDQEPESKERQEESKHELKGILEGFEKYDENIFKRSIKHSRVNNGFIEKRKV